MRRSSRLCGVKIDHAFVSVHDDCALELNSHTPFQSHSYRAFYITYMNCSIPRRVYYAIYKQFLRAIFR